MIKDLVRRFRQATRVSLNQHWEIEWRPILMSDRHRWLSVPFDLRFDAKWTHQPGSSTAMHPDHSISVVVTERPEHGPAGIRFAIGREWKNVAASQRVDLSIVTSCQTGSIPFNLTYTAAGRGVISSTKAEAATTPMSTATRFSMPVISEERPDQLVIEPLALNEPAWV